MIFFDNLKLPKYKCSFKKSTSRYLDDLLYIDNPYFEGMVIHTYPHELQFNNANTTDYIFLLHMDLFLLNFMINMMTFW